MNCALHKWSSLSVKAVQLNMTGFAGLQSCDIMAISLAVFLHAVWVRTDWPCVRLDGRWFCVQLITSAGLLVCGLCLNLMLSGGLISITRCNLCVLCIASTSRTFSNPWTLLTRHCLVQFSYACKSTVIKRRSVPQPLPLAPALVVPFSCSSCLRYI